MGKILPLRVPNELRPLIDALDISNGVMLEVGVYQGESMIQFMTSGKFRRYFGVDFWSGDYADPNPRFLECIPDAEAKFDEVAKQHPVVKMKMTSKEAACYFCDNLFDFVYIDGNHAYEFAKEDLDLWWPKVKYGGYFGGHDYNMADSVGRAVNEKFGHGGMFPDSSWLVRKSATGDRV
jgi:hypothetical protein